MRSVDWTAARARMMLDPGVINLNTGSFGPLPVPVFEQVTVYRQRLAAEPMDFLLRQAPPLLWRARQRLARFLNADLLRLVFMANVTAAINAVAGSLRLAAPGEILLSDHEYGSMHWCWERAARRQGLTLRTFPLPILARTPEDIVAAYRAAITDRTRLLFFSHVLSATGLVLPAREICAAARERGVWTAIDGAHAPGMIPMNLLGLGCDFYAGNCHKWMLAPTGSGFLYLGPGAEDRLQPLQVSWGYHFDPHQADERDEYGSTPRIRALEFEGTRDPCAWLTVPTAISFQVGLGLKRIRARMAELVAYTRQQLDGRAGMHLATAAQPGLHGALTAFRLPPGTDPSALRRGLWERFRIEAPVIERPEGPLLRVSTHFYNTKEEIDRLAVAVLQLLN